MKESRMEQKPEIRKKENEGMKKRRKCGEEEMMYEQQEIGRKYEKKKRETKCEEALEREMD